MRYWLMKTEPDDFSIDDLERVGKEPWSGVRNYQARNSMRDDMKVGDKVLVYHSSCEVPGVYGIGRVASDAYPDPSQFDKRSDYYDAKSTREEPRWLLRDIAFERKLKSPVTLAAIKAHADELEGMVLLRTGNRLSVMPVEKGHYDRVLKLEGKA
jgi:predicted RNA-binding protein with PUA-like domain